MGCEQSTDSNSNSKLTSNKVSSNPNLNSNGIIPHGFKKHQQHQHNLQNGIEKTTGIEMLPLETVRSLLQDYKESDEVIKNLEQRDPLTVFYIKNLQLKQIDEKIESQIQAIDELKKRNHFVGSKKSPAGVKDVLIKLDNKSSVSRDEQDLLVKANRYEIATTELEMLHQERSLVENEVTHRFVTLSQLRNAYQRQEDIIENLQLNIQLPEEIPLQNDLTELESKRMTASETHERWKEGKALIAESCRQFTEARKKWNEFGDGDTLTSLSMHSIHYEHGEEVRDNLIASWQGLHNAKFYLQYDFPYCTDTELQTLQNATSYLFIDLMSEARRSHAESCYVAAHRRTVALLAWVTKVIENILEPELEKLNEILHNKIQALSSVRIDHICSQYPEIHTTMSRPTPKASPNIKETDDDGEIPSSRVRADSITFLSHTLDSESLKLLSELNLTHLAALPSKEELFRKTGSENSNKNDSSNTSTSHEISTAGSQPRSQSQSRIQSRKESIDKNLTDLEMIRGRSNASGERRLISNGFK